MPETFQKAPPEIKQSKPRVENQGNSEKNERNLKAVQKIAKIGENKNPERGFKVTAEQKIEDAKDETRAKTLARAEGRDSPGQPATDIEKKITEEVQKQGKEVIDSEQLRKQRLEEIITELKTQGLPKYVGDLAPSEEYYFTHEVPARAKAILLQRFPEYVAQNTPDKPVTPTAKEPQKDTVPVSTEKQNDAPTEKVATPTNEQTSKTATKEPQKDTVPVTAKNKQATQSTEQQTEQTKQTAEIPQQEFPESRLSEAESVGQGDSQERLEKVVESLKSQVKELENALQKGSEVRENIRKGIFGPKVLFMLRLINILANNSVITKLLSLDSKVADIKDLWGEYQDMKDKTRSRRKSSDSFQGAAAAASGEAPDRGSETKEANFENSNLNFLKEISEEFLKSVIAGLKSEGGGEGLNIDQIRADIIDEIDSLVDVGKEVDVRKLSASNPRIIESIKNSVQNFARGKGTKQSLGLNIMVSIKS